MYRNKRHILGLVTVLLLLAIPSMIVLAKELGSLTISGPGIDGEMTLDHEGGMMKLERTGFFDQSISIKPPADLGAGYNITAYLNLDGQIVPFVQMVYYATDGSQPGFVHYTARLAGETLQPVDEWRQLNKDADIAFRGLMEEYQIALQPALAAAALEPLAKKPAAEQAAVEPAVKEAVAAPVVPAKSPAVSTVSSQWIFLLAVSLFVLLAAALLIRKRAEGRRSPQL